MTDLRQVAQQALEALEGLFGLPNQWESGGVAVWRLGGSDAPRQAITALRTALEQQAEPVAWTGYDLDGMVEAFSRVIEAHHSSKHPFHNPIDMDAKMALRILRGFIPAMKAYATPPQRKPLTNEQADQIISGLQTCHHQSSKREFLKVWLRDWAAHNIKEQP